MKKKDINSKKQKKPRQPSVKKNTRADDDMLSEFSDGYGDFYTDESRRKEAPRKKSPREESRRDDTRRRESRPEKARRDEPRESGRDADRDSRYADELREERLRERREQQTFSLKAERKPKSPLRRKLTRILSTFAIVAVILITGVVLSLTVLFKTERYEIVGNRLYLDSDVISTCGIAEGENIFLAPKKPAEERIVRRFPYFESVNVTFGIPDTIRIEIKEAVEGYLFKISDSEYLLISTKGRILNRLTDVSDLDLPIFIGPTLSSGEIGDYVSYEDDAILSIIDSITTAFADNGYQGITEIDATDPAAITFTYQSRIKVKLGIPEDISYKIRTAMTIINNNIDVNPSSRLMGVLDVSRCNITKRSYFNEEDITATEPPTEPPTEAGTTSDDYSGYQDGGEYSGYTDETSADDGYSSYDSYDTYDSYGE